MSSSPPHIIRTPVMLRHKSAAVIALVTFVSAAGAAPAPGTRQDRAYCEGGEVQLEVSASRMHFRPNETFRLGPWKFGDKVREEKQRDGRPNLYVVLPGAQYTNEKWPGY